MKQWVRRRRARPALAGAAVIALAAWTGPVERAAPAEESASCQFEIKASNNLSFDVWVDLYDSSVLRTNSILRRWVRLKIQSHRIRSGESMDRRYTAAGPCDADRLWSIQARRGRIQREILIQTSGSSSTSRTVDLGPSSKWKWSNWSD